MGAKDWPRAVEMFELCVLFSPTIEGYRKLLIQCREHIDASPCA